ncbi:hypothetical protein, partial [Streptococcus pneumoniae]|uniref:hypothetical protein n=1 Tax=Streptococcus pneumoniae TaxID=1313 RepID=UPI0018B07225
YLTQNDTAPRTVRSYGVNALLNNTFADLVTRKLTALEQASYGDMTGMRDCKQQDECLPWEETYLTVTIEAGASAYKVEDYADG